MRNTNFCNSLGALLAPYHIFLDFGSHFGCLWASFWIPQGFILRKNVVDFESLHWFPTLSGWLVGWVDWFAWFAWLVGLDSWLGSWLNWLIDWVGKMKRQQGQRRRPNHPQPNGYGQAECAKRSAAPPGCGVLDHPSFSKPPASSFRP